MRRLFPKSFAEKKVVSSGKKSTEVQLLLMLSGSVGACRVRKICAGRFLKGLFAQFSCYDECRV